MKHQRYMTCGENVFLAIPIHTGNQGKLESEIMFSNQDKFDI